MSRAPDSLAAVIAGALVVVQSLTPLATARVAAQDPVRFGGTYAALDERRRALIDNWVGRLSETTAQKIEPAAFYDTFIRVSTKTTFEAITHALMTTVLSDTAGAPLGDALQLIARIDGVRGRVPGDASDRQFRMYVRLRPDALDTLGRSRQFRRRADNTVFHQGYPINFRGQGGTPSIQISVALDKQHADIDVDYRSSVFPTSMFNGHLTASNSDVSAGGNYDRHTQRWSGFQNWWRHFFGISLSTAEDAERANDVSRATEPRVGRKPVETMMEDFLKAWLLEGDIRAAMSYISPRAYACVAEETDDALAFDRGMAPFVLAHRLKASHDALGARASLEGLTFGVRLTRPELRTVRQPHHAQFVLYAVPDDVAAVFDCESRRSLARSERVERAYGDYYGATFYITGAQRPTTLALLWGRERGFWQIVSWQTDPEGDEEMPTIPPPPQPPAPTRIPADVTLVDAARGFLERWLVRKDYEGAFSYLSPASYSCYELVRGSDQPPATSLEDAGRKIREALERVGTEIGRVDRLENIISAVPPVHPALRIMNHRDANTFALSSVPDTLVAAINCAVRAQGEPAVVDAPPTYGTGFAMTVRFRTRAGDPPVLRMLWVKESGAWRISMYDVDVP